MRDRENVIALIRLDGLEQPAFCVLEVKCDTAGRTRQDAAPVGMRK